MSSLSLEIVTAQRTLLAETSIQRAKIATSFGYMGAEPGHAPLLAVLVPGILEYTKIDGEIEEFYVNGGIVEVQKNKVTVLADEGLRTDELDAKAIEKAEASARAIADSSDSAPMDKTAALATLSALAIQRQMLKKRGH